jgi:small subunit ribosomal protein S3
MTAERKFIDEGVKRQLIREYLRKRVKKSGFGGAEIQRTLIGTRIVLIVERPGLVIGRGGRLIASLTEDLREKFDIDNPIIEVADEKNPNLNTEVMASKLANFIERGWHFRRLGHNSVRNIMESGALGCQIIFSGKLTGDRHRTEKFNSGHIKYCGEVAEKYLKTGYSVAYTKPGCTGVAVKVMDKDTREPTAIIFKEDLPKEIKEEEIKEEEIKEEKKGGKVKTETKKTETKKTETKKTETKKTETKGKVKKKTKSRSEKGVRRKNEGTGDKGSERGRERGASEEHEVRASSRESDDGNGRNSIEHDEDKGTEEDNSKNTDN